MNVSDLMHGLEILERYKSTPPHLMGTLQDIFEEAGDWFIEHGKELLLDRLRHENLKEVR